MLSHRKIVLIACLFDVQSCGCPRRGGCADEICIETRTGAYFTRSAPSVAKMQRDGILRVSGDNHDSSFSFSTVYLKFHVVAGRDVDALRRCRADHGRVVPGESRVGFGKLLQPAIVSEPAVEDCRVRAERNFQIRGTCSLSLFVCWSCGIISRADVYCRQ